MDARADAELQALELRDDGERAANRTARAVEGCEEAVAGMVDFPAAELPEQTTHGLIVLAAKGSPADVSEFCQALGGTDEIGEEDRRRGPRRSKTTRRAKDARLDLAARRIVSLRGCAHAQGHK